MKTNLKSGSILIAGLGVYPNSVDGRICAFPPEFSEPAWTALLSNPDVHFEISWIDGRCKLNDLYFSSCTAD